MELKKYQKQVVADLKDYLAQFEDATSPAEAYQRFWEHRQIAVGEGGVPEYQDILAGVPRVCFKVPTGGGKTLLAAASLRLIFDALPPGKPKVVVWLVPTEAILSQTLNTLNSPEHPYRQKLNLDFGSRVEIYSKQQLLVGQNFSPVSVKEQLSVMVLTYDSFRREKEKIQAFKANEHLSAFVSYLGTPDHPIPLAEEGSLFQIINQLNPVVLVDESHHTSSRLSQDMLSNFNPSLVLDLTATPGTEANIISYVDAYQIKNENMVKLPVIAYNRSNREEVISDAIDLRNSLENTAKEERHLSGRYIRPIVLFQAEPKAREDATSFEKLRRKLIMAGVPAEQIAIKTAKIDELKGVDLLSEACPVRYVITVNALGEGWDCPFAYILATLANKTSAVSVEQILGRVLRQPYAQRYGSNLLNMSYVLSASADFSAILKNIIQGLNNVGFTAQDYRVAEDLFSDVGNNDTEDVGDTEDGTGGTETLLDKKSPEKGATDDEEDFLDFEPDKVSDDLSQRNEGAADASDHAAKKMMEEAQKQGNDYDVEVSKNKDKSTSSGLGGGVFEKVKVYSMSDDLEDDALALRIPQFHIETPPNIINPEGGFDLLSPDNLSEGFTLVGKSYEIDVKSAMEDMFRIDVNKKGLTPQVVAMRQSEQKILRDQFAQMPKESRIRQCSEIIFERLNRNDAIDASDLRSYVQLLVGSLDSSQLAVLEDSPQLVARAVEQLVLRHLGEHRRKEFHRLIETGRIRTSPSYQLPNPINLSNPSSMIGGSLYEAEDSMNGEEEELALKFGSLDNVVWWHRVIERRGFHLNGFFNHYPDFLVKTAAGKVIAVEYKGAQLDGSDAEQKLALGKTWADLSGPDYRYYMVFKDGVQPLPGALTTSGFYALLADL